MAFDYKKEYKEFYLPPKQPGMIEIPTMNYVAVRGSGDPNEPEGEYKQDEPALWDCLYYQNELQGLP